MGIIKPPRLKKGDLIGIMSPSAPITPGLEEQLHRGIATLENLGYRVRLAPNARRAMGHQAGTREQRLADLHDLWSDSDVKMVLFSQGGCCANDLLDGIDYRAMRKSPKIVAGISDGTTLLNPIAARAGIVTFHGPDLLWAFGREMSEGILQNTLDTFCGRPIGALKSNPSWKRQSSGQDQYRGWKCIRSGRATGRLVGGHLASLINIGFAGYGPDYSGRILFIEGTEPELAALEKALNALRLKGVFGQIVGLVVGWFDNIESGTGLDRSVGDLVREVTRDAKCPILEVGELGHNVENYVLPIGCQATIDAGELYFSIDESPVS